MGRPSWAGAEDSVHHADLVGDGQARDEADEARCQPQPPGQPGKPSLAPVSGQASPAVTSIIPAIVPTPNTSR